MQLSTITAPVILKILRKPAAAHVQFPDGSVWEYLVHDDSYMDILLRKYGRNKGKLVAALKKFKSRRVR